MTQSIADDIDTSCAYNARIKVFGVGGGGGNAVQTMINSNLEGVQFICANTDNQALRANDAPIKIQLGEKATRGLGAGGDPTVGRDAALESSDRIREALANSDMVFITAGMGGGTGSGAAPVIAEEAKKLNLLTVGVVTKPFSWEGNKRNRIAEEALDAFKKNVDCLIVIPNDRLLAFAGNKETFQDTLKRANEVLHYAVKGISDAILCEGYINVDFADVRSVMSETGLALMGTGEASGEDRAKEAATKAISSPLLEDISLNSAKAILYNVTATRNISAGEIREIGEIIQKSAPHDCNIIFGVVFDDNIGDMLRITVVATGIEQDDPSNAVDVNHIKQFKPVIQQRNNLASQESSHKPVWTPQTKEPDLNNITTPIATIQSRPVEEVPTETVIAAPPPIIHSQQVQQNQQPSIVRTTYTQQRPRRHIPGQEQAIYDVDNGNLDVPTFLRNNAN